MRVLVFWMTLRLLYRTKFRVFSGKAPGRLDYETQYTAQEERGMTQRVMMMSLVVLGVVAVQDPGHQEGHAEEEVPRPLEPQHLSAGHVDDLVDEGAHSKKGSSRN